MAKIFLIWYLKCNDIFRCNSQNLISDFILYFWRAVLALKQSKAKVEAILQGKDLIMTFHGIGQFNNQVIYVKMSEENQKMLSRIASKYLT